MSHHENSGLQSHSIGDTYPWGVKIVANKRFGHCIAWNLLTNEHANKFAFQWDQNAFSGVVGSLGTFETAHKLAENVAAALLAEDKQYAPIEAAVAKDEAFADLARADREDRQNNALRIAAAKDEAFAESPKRLAEYRFLIPTTRNGGMQPHNVDLLNSFKNWLLQAFGGYTIGGLVVGCWVDGNGKEITDHSNTYYVATDNPDLLLAWLPYWAGRFDQECLYVAKTSDDARLIPAAQ